MMRVVRGQVANAFGGEVEFHRITESLCQEKNSPPIVREIGALAEPGYLRDVRRQVIGGILAGFGFRGLGARSGDACEQRTDWAFHRLPFILLLPKQIRGRPCLPRPDSPAAFPSICGKG